MARTLIIEDDVETRKSLATGFRKHGYLVDQAGSVDEALQKLAESSYDVVDSDVDLGDNQGRTGVNIADILARKVAIEGNRMPVFILHSGRLEQKLQEEVPLYNRLKAEGIIKEFIPKPYEREDVVSIVTGLLSKVHPLVKPAEEQERGIR